MKRDIVFEANQDLSKIFRQETDPSTTEGLKYLLKLYPTGPVVNNIKKYYHELYISSIC